MIFKIDPTKKTYKVWFIKKIFFTTLVDTYVDIHLYVH